MRMTDIIAKKRDDERLSTQEIHEMIAGYTKGEVPDYQMSALLMAILWRGMDDTETKDLTEAMVQSGEVLELSDIDGMKADKHSTGGVGDKTSLALLPMMAAQGVKMAKMSGRGLGHTGGTIDKLESFTGYNADMSQESFKDTVRKLGFTISGQSADLVPADKKLYALRDVTGTVPSVPLITASIMSKKLAAGADVIVLDVKCGNGSFMKNLDDARELAESMVRVGKLAGRRTTACITDMDEPLGHTVGNILEVKEAIALLNGEYGGRLLELCLVLGSAILTQCGIYGSDAEARAALLRSIEDKSALEKLADYIEYCGGDRREVYDTSLLKLAPIRRELFSQSEGYVQAIDTEGVGLCAMHLGGGRATKSSVIDLTVGIELKKKRGEYVKKGECLAIIHAADEAPAIEACDMLLACYSLGDTAPAEVPLLMEVIT